jgi:ankyrin repeat protein
MALTKNRPNIVLKLLLAPGDDIRKIINKQDEKGDTALHKIKHQPEHGTKDAQAQGVIVKLLLAFGADPKIKNKQGLLPLQDDKYKEGFNAIKEFLEMEGCEVYGAKGGSEIGSAKIQNPRGRKKTKQDSGEVELDTIDSSLRGGLYEFKEGISPAVEGKGDMATEVSILGQSVNNAEPGDGCMLPSSSSLTQTEEDKDWEPELELFGATNYLGQAYGSISSQERSQESSQKLNPYEIVEFVPFEKSDESIVVNDLATEMFLSREQEYQQGQEWGQEQDYSAPGKRKDIAQLLVSAMGPRTDEPISFFRQPTQAPHREDASGFAREVSSALIVAMHDQDNLSEVTGRRSNPEGERDKIVKASTAAATLCKDMIQQLPLASAPQPEILASSSQKEILSQDKKSILETIKHHTLHENFPQNKKEKLYKDIENWIRRIERDRKGVNTEKLDYEDLNCWAINFLSTKPSFHNIKNEERKQLVILFTNILGKGTKAINEALASDPKNPENNLVKNLFQIISTPSQGGESLKKIQGRVDLPTIEMPKIYKLFIDSNLSFKGFTDKFNYAINENKPELLQKLIDHNPDHIGKEFTKLLNMALTKNRPNIVLKLLLAPGDDIRKIINKQDEKGDTALHKIKHQPEHGTKDVQAQGVIIVKLLLAFGADPTIKNKQGLLPLQDDKYKKGFNAIKEFLEIAVSSDLADERLQTLKGPASSVTRVVVGPGSVIESSLVPSEVTERRPTPKGEQVRIEEASSVLANATHKSNPRSQS